MRKPAGGSRAGPSGCGGRAAEDSSSDRAGEQLVQKQAHFIQERCCQDVAGGGVGEAAEGGSPGPAAESVLGREEHKRRLVLPPCYHGLCRCPLCELGQTLPPSGPIWKIREQKT